MLCFENYDQISDIIDWLGKSVRYKFVTKLAGKDKDGNRNSFHKEYSYRSQYVDTSMSCSVVRSFEYYVQIESLYDRNIYIQIRPNNMIMIQNVLNQMTNLLFDENYWIIKNKKLNIKGKPNPIVIHNLPFGKWLSFELIVIEWDNQFDKGIRISLSDDSAYTDIRIDQFMGFVYFMNSLNMYQCALELLNYIQRPEFGTNLVSYDTDRNPNIINNEEIQAKNRTIQNKQQRSFFDKISNIDE
jgi:hypothetical protein